MSKQSPYRMSISLSVLDHLGLNLYSNVPAVLSEAVANSWDADAKKVVITIDTKAEKITIEDDGHGMSESDINGKYLHVGYCRRATKEGAISPKFLRPVMGRKGIGKLSLFSIADIVEVRTRRNGTESALRLSGSDIREQIKSGDGIAEYQPLPIELTNQPKGDGTILTLKSLKRNITARTADALRTRLARRFYILGKRFNFELIVNGTEVTLKDRNYLHKLQYVWWYGDVDDEIRGLCKNVREDHHFARSGVLTGLPSASDSNGTQESENPDGQGSDGASAEIEPTPSSDDENSVKGWIATVRKPSQLKDDSGDTLNKISVLARGKLAVEDILDQFGEGGVYSAYIIGELRADLLDTDGKEDIATSSRQAVKEDDPRFVALRNFVRSELKNIEATWGDLRNTEGTQQAIEIPAVKNWYESLGPDPKKSAKRILGAINRLTVEAEKDRRTLIKHAVMAFERLRLRESLSELEAVPSNDLSGFLKAFHQIDDLEAVLYQEIVRERVSVIDALKRMVDTNVLEKVLQEHLFNHLWLLDPAWERAEATERMEETVKKEFGAVSARLTSEEKQGRVDIRYRKTWGAHLIVELKRPERKVRTSELMDQCKKYIRALKKCLRAVGENAPIEAVCVLGHWPVGWDDAESRMEDENALKQYGIRVVTYETLLEQANKAYADFLRKRKAAVGIAKLIDEIDAED